MSERIALEEDTLFLACTRPAMIGGVTMEAMGINMIFTTILFIVAGSVAYALVGLVFHVIFKAIVKHDTICSACPRLIENAQTLATAALGGSSLTKARSAL